MQGYPTGRVPDHHHFDFWHGVIAALLALLLLAMWLWGHGPFSGCCGRGDAPSPVTSPAVLPSPAHSGSSGVPVQSAPLPAPTTSPAPPVVPVAAALTMMWEGGKLVLSGNVKNEPARKAMVDAAALQVGAGNVVDQLKVNAGAQYDTLTLRGAAVSEEEKDKTGIWATRTAVAASGVPMRVDNLLNVAAAVAVTKPATSKVANLPANVYFAVGSTAMPAQSQTALAPIVAFANANPAARIVLSGFHDPTGNQAQNAELAKNRAKAVRAALETAGVKPDRIDMQKPQVTAGTGDNKEARRVEVTVTQ
jgi:outer membrane protein OmpA-like peptidoglycan-associated protein